MPYGKNSNIKQSNVNYLAKDFTDLKSSLMTYAKSYFPNTYRDFNETSPGMMLIEMSAYVGDVLNFYIDQQYKELMLPLAEEKKNLITLARSQGYKVNPASPAYATIEFEVTVGADGDGNILYNQAPIIAGGASVKSVTDETLIFETLDVVDFTVSSSSDPLPEVKSVNTDTGVPSTYSMKRRVRSISGETKSANFNINDPKRFHKITLTEKNIIEIIKVVDGNNNVWYEVDSLAQDKVTHERHYTSDQDRTTAYHSHNGTKINLPVPYSLEFIQTSKRFITEVSDDGKTSLIFGNGVLKNGNTFDSTFLAVEQVGINLPGAENNLDSSIDPLLGDAYGTLGEAPSHTSLTITYRVGGGSNANTGVNMLQKIHSATSVNNIPLTSLKCNNLEPAVGGTSGESIEEIRHRSIAHISTQRRCVTKSDYEARTLSLPAKFGNIAKVYCTRAGDIRTTERQKVVNVVNRLKEVVGLNFDMFNSSLPMNEQAVIFETLRSKLDADQSGGISPNDINMLLDTLDMTYSNVVDDDRLYTIDLYLLSYDNSKNLIHTPSIIKQNLKEYLNNYRLLTDQVSFHDGYIINFGVVFDVVAQQYENKEEVKIKCINAIKNYYRIDKMQFKQILYTSDIENLLMDIDGVRAVNYVTLTQDRDWNSESCGTSTEKPAFSPPLYSNAINSDGTESISANQLGYGYYYDFGDFYGSTAVAGKGIILPAYEPSVFHLKQPNRNIKGVVR